MVREEWILLQWLSSIFGKNIGRAGDRTRCILLSSPVRYRLSYGARLLTIGQKLFSFCSLILYQQFRLLTRLLTHYQTTNFRLFQTERVCRRQFQIWRKWKKVIQTGRKHCGKRRNCSWRAISPFPTVFFKRLVSQGRQSVLLCGNGLNFQLKTSWIKMKILVSRNFLFIPPSFLPFSKTDFVVGAQVNVSSTFRMNLWFCKPFPELKEIADDKVNFDENVGKFSKWVENCGNRRNCSLWDHVKVGLAWERVTCYE